MSRERGSAAARGRAGKAEELGPRLEATRRLSARLAEGLAAEDQVVQSMPEASPTKWHLAHTSWFFETFVLESFEPGYRPFHAKFRELFNSYYEAVGPMHPRPQRGLLSRPAVAEVMRYRAHVDAAMQEFLIRGAGEAAAARIELGLQHEQQHQELVLTDLLHAFAQNPLRPSYREATALPSAPRPEKGSQAAAPARWIGFGGGVGAIGHTGPGFAFDNELPRHELLVRPFELASRPVTCGELAEFIDDGGYHRPELWLADGWATARALAWRAPAYWERHDDAWFAMTLDGMQPVVDAAPASHLSYYEADAFARWRGARLPTEAEWELAARGAPAAGNTLGSGALRPLPARGGGGLEQLVGDVWEWTASPYAPYPGYAPATGAVGEYSGKFMCNQMVLRGGSALTPDGHARVTYRNFFYPAARWQMTGLRLARDVTDA
jgi:ergothioneine biosynthesis protein EgtB